MNNIENQLVHLLNTHKKQFSVLELKAEFESEGARFNELVRLRHIASVSGLGLVLKTGGPEAIRDLQDACVLGVEGIVAPMVETAYALYKYLLAIETQIPSDLRDDIVFAVNIETISACNNFSAMCDLPLFNLLGRITVGRVDLSGSMGIGRDKIESPEVSQVTQRVFELSKNLNLETTLGGAITPETIPFIKTLVSAGLLDRFETRKVVFDARIALDEDLASEAILFAHKVELLWLSNKQNYYSRIAGEDSKRIEMLRNRVSR